MFFLLVVRLLKRFVFFDQNQAPRKFGSERGVFKRPFRLSGYWGCPPILDLPCFAINPGWVKYRELGYQKKHAGLIHTFICVLKTVAQSHNSRLTPRAESVIFALDFFEQKKACA